MLHSVSKKDLLEFEKSLALSQGDEEWVKLCEDKIKNEEEVEEFSHKIISFAGYGAITVIVLALILVIFW